MRLNILIGGKAGQGPNILADLVSKGLIERGFYVFNSREYESVIRGGHNFNELSLSDSPIASNTCQQDILVCLDELTEKLHKKNLSKKALVLKTPNKSNMFFAGCVFKILGLNFKLLESELRKLKNFDQNMRDARQGYNNEKNSLPLPVVPKKALSFMSGSEATAAGAVASGLDYYYAYPMTPATPLLFELAHLQAKKENHHITLELENEIAVINAAIGSSIACAKAMCGTSGGGFDLMTEALSLAGQAEVPVVVYLASRPGPSTGLATYTSQADLNVARFAGHGEFPRILIAPGDAAESISAANQAFFLSQKFRTPAILLSDKHLAESKYSFEQMPETIAVKNSIILPERFNSYEHNPETAIATEEPKIITSNFKRRLKKQNEIAKEAREFEMFKIHGKKDSKNLILGWGSTKGAILDAITESRLNAKFLQVIYIEPFSEKIKDELKKAQKVVVIENNATSPLSALIAEKTGFFVDDANKILRCDGRPFLADELAAELKKRGVK